MNIIYISPHFPPQQYLYCRSLRELGVTTLGIGDRPWEGLAPEQREALAGYAMVPDLEDYDAVRDAVSGFITLHGSCDRVESHNEHWLLHEARLRLEFGIPGDRPEEIEKGRRKSRMKAVFQEGGVPVARGAPASSLESARDFARRVGFPIVLKPDIGVGASGTYRIGDDATLASFFERKGNADYFMEEFIGGTIQTFDGLAGCDGRIICGFSFEYSRGVMEVVNEDADIYYFTLRTIPDDLVEIGTRSVRAFDVRDRFFHMEFFRTRDRGLVALEANLRPPGGYSLDMYNYSCDGDLYRAWAQMVAGRTVRRDWRSPYHCAFVNRKWRYRYRHAHEEILARHGGTIVLHTPMPAAFRNAMGDYAYLIRTTSLEEMHAIVDFIQAKDQMHE
jgi:biotin carboxylase